MEAKEKINSILTGIEDNLQNLYELAQGYDIYFKTTKLPPEIWGFVYKSTYDNYFIIINKNLSHEIQQKVFIHELKHIRDDIPNNPYLIGMNMQHSDFEKNADLFAKEKKKRLGMD